MTYSFIHDASWPAAVTAVSAAEHEAALLSLSYDQYIREDLGRDPVDALQDAEMLLAEAQRCAAILTAPALRYIQGERLRRLYRTLPDRGMIAIAECLVNYNKARIATAFTGAARGDDVD